jgi:hypothetical protein
MLFKILIQIYKIVSHFSILVNDKTNYNNLKNEKMNDQK